MRSPRRDIMMKKKLKRNRKKTAVTEGLRPESVSHKIQRKQVIALGKRHLQSGIGEEERSCDRYSVPDRVEQIVGDSVRN